MRKSQAVATITWHPGGVLENCPIWQAYIFAVTPNKKVILVRDSNETRFTLPGGRIEDNETAEEGALRELREEAQVYSIKTVLLGVIEVKDLSQSDSIQAYHQQVRYVCHVEGLEEFIPNKDGFEIAERIIIEPIDIPNYIHWMNRSNGRAQYQAFRTYVDGLSGL